MRIERDGGHGERCAPADLTRRGFVRVTVMSVLPLSYRARAAALDDGGPAGDPWRQARAVLRAGVLGRIAWVAVRYPTGGGGGVPSAASCVAHVQRLLPTLHDPTAASRLSVLGDAEPTAMVQLEGGTVLYAAPGGPSAAEPRAVVRGERARLLVFAHGVSVRAIP